MRAPEDGVGRAAQAGDKGSAHGREILGLRLPCPRCESNPSGHMCARCEFRFHSFGGMVQALFLYGLHWATRPFAAKLRRRREPSPFHIYAARKAIA